MARTGCANSRGDVRLEPAAAPHAGRGGGSRAAGRVHERRRSPARALGCAASRDRDAHGPRRLARTACPSAPRREPARVVRGRSAGTRRRVGWRAGAARHESAAGWRGHLRRRADDTRAGAGNPARDRHGAALRHIAGHQRISFNPRSTRPWRDRIAGSAAAP